MLAHPPELCQNLADDERLIPKSALYVFNVIFNVAGKRDEVSHPTGIVRGASRGHERRRDPNAVIVRWLSAYPNIRGARGGWRGHTSAAAERMNLDDVCSVFVDRRRNSVQNDGAPVALPLPRVYDQHPSAGDRACGAPRSTC